MNSTKLDFEKNMRKKKSLSYIAKMCFENVEVGMPHTHRWGEKNCAIC